MESADSGKTRDNGKIVLVEVLPFGFLVCRWWLSMKEFDYMSPYFWLQVWHDHRMVKNQCQDE